VAAAAALVVLLAGIVRAGVPDPRNCQADTCLVLSPSGAFTYTVVLRDESSAPIANATVSLDFLPAPGMALCPGSDPDSDGRVLGMTDAVGRVDFQVRGGGQTTGHVVVGSLGTTVRIAYPRATDLNGDLAVSQQDVDLHAALPANSRAGDYDCDGDADATDRAAIQAQLGQDCDSTGVLSSTWGRVKATYR
jgi:hypothetical protein